MGQRYVRAHSVRREIFKPFMFITGVLEKMVGRDGIEPPTPGFSGLGVGGTIGHDWTPSGRISGSCWHFRLDLFPMAPDSAQWSDTLLTQQTQAMT